MPEEIDNSQVYGATHFGKCDVLYTYNQICFAIMKLSVDEFSRNYVFYMQNLMSV